MARGLQSAKPWQFYCCCQINSITLVDRQLLEISECLNQTGSLTQGDITQIKMAARPAFLLPLYHHMQAETPFRRVIFFFPSAVFPRLDFIFRDSGATPSAFLFVCTHSLLDWESPGNFFTFQAAFCGIITSGFCWYFYILCLTARCDSSDCEMERKKKKKKKVRCFQQREDGFVLASRNIKLSMRW